MRRTLVIYRRELLSYFTTPIAYMFIPIFVGLMKFFFFKFPSNFFLNGQADLREFFTWMPIALAFFVPTITMRTWSEELRVGTAEMLLTLPYRVWELVLGKFLAAYTVLLVTLACTLDVLVGVGYAGDPDWGVAGASYIGALLMGAAFTALGVFFSSLTQNQVVALLMSWFLGVLMTVVFHPVAVSWTLGAYPGVAQFFGALGIPGHFQVFQLGIVALEDVVYFLTLVVLFLGLNIFRVESRRY